MFHCFHLISFPFFFFSLFTFIMIDNDRVPFELPHDKTYKMTCAPREDSDQPGHPPV